MEDIYSAIKLTIGKLLAKTEEFENQLNFGKSLEFYQRLVTRVADAIQLLEASCSSSPAVHNHLNHHPQKAKIDWLKSIHEAAIAEMEELEVSNYWKFPRLP